ncbi:MAG TPA: hypothetical protein VFG69_11590 [Nannocystaceae bacterium]|nr:hypothetical protein [Nannocystaceae bacterium]
MIALRHAVRFAGIASLLAACFVDPPPAVATDGTTGDECVSGQQGCECFGNGSCEAGLECNPDVHLCIPERCMPGDLACVCANGDCVPPYVCTGSLCMPMSTVSETSDGSADTSGGSMPTSGVSAETSTSSTDSGLDSTSSAGGSSSDGDPTGVQQCDEQDCPACVDCVDTQACAPEVAACDAVNGCATAVECLIQCGVYLDCLDPCCPGLTAEQIAVVNDLVLCKSDECVATCEGEAEIDGCR